MPEPLPNLPDRKSIKAALRAAGLSDRQARALLGKGWRALVGESQAEAEDVRERLDELLAQLGPDLP